MYTNWFYSFLLGWCESRGGVFLLLSQSITFHSQLIKLDIQSMQVHFYPYIYQFWCSFSFVNIQTSGNILPLELPLTFLTVQVCWLQILSDFFVWKSFYFFVVLKGINAAYMLSWLFFYFMHFKDAFFFLLLCILLKINIHCSYIAGSVNIFYLLSLLWWFSVYH